MLDERSNSIISRYKMTTTIRVSKQRQRQQQQHKQQNASYPSKFLFLALSFLISTKTIASSSSSRRNAPRLISSGPTLSITLRDPMQHSHASSNKSLPYLSPEKLRHRFLRSRNWLTSENDESSYRWDDDDDEDDEKKNYKTNKNKLTKVFSTLSPSLSYSIKSYSSSQPPFPNILPCLSSFRLRCRYFANDDTILSDLDTSLQDTSPSAIPIEETRPIMKLAALSPTAAKIILFPTSQILSTKRKNTKNLVLLDGEIKLRSSNLARRNAQKKKKRTLKLFPLLRSDALSNLEASIYPSYHVKHKKLYTTLRIGTVNNSNQNEEHYGNVFQLANRNQEQRSNVNRGTLKEEEAEVDALGTAATASTGGGRNERWRGGRELIAKFAFGQDQVRVFSFAL
uniref:Uncharacterized protein n=1 Tax=Ditylum brightwellii TaxID=49249 RepID=A0A6V2BIY8_9STRA